MQTNKIMNGEIPLPEEVIQHIQSFMSTKEAARSAVISKSWYNAWFTRPTIDLDYGHFWKIDRESRAGVFGEFATKTMQRYLDSSLKIESFRLSCSSFLRSVIARKVIVSAMKMGPTSVTLEMSHSFALPKEVFGSETLLRLSLISCKIDVSYVMSCSRLESLTLKDAKFKRGDVFKDIIGCCISMEELSLSNCIGVTLSSANLYELHKLRRLFLYKVDADSTFFFRDFASRFPCLKDLTIHECSGYKIIQIASTSIETITFVTARGSERATFDVPNIRTFTYSGSGIPSDLSINGASSEWEFQIYIVCKRFCKAVWFMKLKKLLKKFTLSRISLYIGLPFTWRHWTADPEDEGDVEAVPNPLVVETLKIDAEPKFIYALLARSFKAFRPKFITHHGQIKYSWMIDKEKSSDTLHERLLRQLFVSNWQEKFGQFGLKKVNVEICDEFDTEWRPLESKKPIADSKVRLPLIWED